MENLPREQIPKKAPEKIASILMMEAGMEFAFLIAGPLIAGIFAGKWLDAKTNHNFFVVLGILFGTFISCFAIYKRIKDYKKLLEKKISK